MNYLLAELNTTQPTNIPVPTAFGTGDPISVFITFFIINAVLLFIYPKFILFQAILELEKSATDLEDIADKSRGYVTKALSIKSGSRMKDKIRNFMDFFAIPPVDIDPYGVVKKLDHIIKNADNRLKIFVREISPNISYEKESNIKNAIAGAMMTHQIAKIVRHYLEQVKKYKIYQLAILLQMQIPLIARIAKAAEKATFAFVEEIPIGDGVGPLVVANLIKSKAKIYEDEEFVVSKAKIRGRTVFISKARGPGASTGYPGKFLIKFLRKQKIDRIITIDAGLRLEGEKTGGIAEGVGIAIGGPGVDRFEIEEIATRMNLPVDAIIVKVSEEEALMPMHKDIVNSVSRAIETIESAVERSRKNQRILLMGVGNTCGVGNDLRSVSEAERKVKAYYQKIEEKRKKSL